MLSVVALMVLLLPVLLRTTTTQKLTSLALNVHGSSSELPPVPTGPLESVKVYREDVGYRVQIEIRNTDVNASQGDTEVKEFRADDPDCALQEDPTGCYLGALQTLLAVEIKTRDPQQERVILVPAASTQTEEVVRWMDAVRAWPQGELFPQVVLASEDLGAGVIE